MNVMRVIGRIIRMIFQVEIYLSIHICKNEIEKYA